MRAVLNICLGPIRPLLTHFSGLQPSRLPAWSRQKSRCSATTRKKPPCSWRAAGQAGRARVARGGRRVRTGRCQATTCARRTRARHLATGSLSLCRRARARRPYPALPYPAPWPATVPALARSDGAARLSAAPGPARVGDPDRYLGDGLACVVSGQEPALQAVWCALACKPVAACQRLPCSALHRRLCGD